MESLPNIVENQIKKVGEKNQSAVMHSVSLAQEIDQQISANESIRNNESLSKNEDFVGESKDNKTKIRKGECYCDLPNLS
jgi:hypothetical protein